MQPRRITAVKASTEYSSVCPFNRDNSRLLLIQGDNLDHFALYDGNGRFLRDLFNLPASCEPRWSRTDPAVLYYLAGNQLRGYNVQSGMTGVVHTFAEYSVISGNGESDISEDGDHLVLVGDSREIFVFEISTRRKGSVFNAAADSALVRAFDSVYITPGNDVLVSWLAAGNGRQNGVELYNREMQFLRQVTRAGGHMDVGRDANGDEVLVWTNSNDPAPCPDCPNGIVKVRLADGWQTCLQPLDWAYAVHISCADRGSCFVETYDPSGRLPGEIIHLGMDGQVLARFPHGSSARDYTAQPKVACSRDGSRVVYTSDAGGSPGVYLALLGAGSAGTPPAPVIHAVRAAVLEFYGENLVGDVSVTIGAEPAEVLYADVGQVNVRVPAAAPGILAPAVVTVDGRASNEVMVAI